MILSSKEGPIQAPTLVNAEDILEKSLCTLSAGSQNQLIPFCNQPLLNVVVIHGTANVDPEAMYLMESFVKVTHVET